MNDYLGKELAVGDTIIMITPGYRDFTKGKIVRFTPQYAIIEMPKTVRWSGYPNGIKQQGYQLIKIEE
jgi:hypothetical protein